MDFQDAGGKGSKNEVSRVDQKRRVLGGCKNVLLSFQFSGEYFAGQLGSCAALITIVLQEWWAAS